MITREEAEKKAIEYIKTLPLKGEHFLMLGQLQLAMTAYDCQRIFNNAGTSADEVDLVFYERYFGKDWWK